MRQTTLVYNPQAGSINLTATIELVADFWRARGWRVTIRATEAPGHAVELAQAAAAAGHRMVLAAGGDGTLGDVVNGLAGTETVLAPLPAGTSNSFAKELMMPLPGFGAKHKLLQAAATLADGKVQQMDLGYAYLGEPPGHGRYWLLWSGIGADGFLVDAVEPRPRWSKRFGPLDYIVRGLIALPQLPPMEATVSVDGHTLTGTFALIVVSNCRYYARELRLNPHAYLDDGMFEVWLFRGNGFGKMVQHLINVMRGAHVDHPDVTMINGRSVAIQTDPVMPCHTDGESAGHSPLRVAIKPQALRILVPGTAPANLFKRPGEPL